MARPGRKKKATGHADFESRNKTTKLTKVCRDMMQSIAWKELKMAQRGLYLEFKGKYSVNSCGNDNRDNISIPKSEAMGLYGDLRTFRNDLDALIQKGFVRCIKCGATTREPSIYGFSDRWKEYGTDSFNVPFEDLRPHFRGKHGLNNRGSSTGELHPHGIYIKDV